MDRDKLAQLRKKKAEAKAKSHKEILDSNASIKEAVLALHEVINAQKPYDDSKLVQQLKDLKDSQTYGEDIKRLETALKQSSNEKKLDDIIKAVGNINNKDVVGAVNNLIEKLEENTPNQDADNFQPVRRVIRVGQRLVFDDVQTPVALGGVSSGRSSVQPSLTRDTGDGKAIAVVNPDGTPIAGGSGGGEAAFADSGGTNKKGLVDGDRHVQVDVLSAPPVTVDTAGLATSENQDGQTDVLEEIRDNQLPDGHNVTVDNLPSDYPLPTSQVTTLTPQTDALTDTQLRATAVPVSGTVTANKGSGFVDPQIDGLTDTQLRATPVEVDTGLTIPTPQTDALTNAELRFEPIDVNTGLEGDVESIKNAVEGTLEVDTGLSPLTDSELRATPVPVSSVDKGTYAYASGVSGTENITGRVTGISAYSSGAGSVAIDSGDSITIPAGGSVELNPNGNLVDPSIVFTNTTSYIVEYVT